MKKFFTTTFACVLGVMIAGIHSETKHYHEIGFRYRYRP